MTMISLPHMTWGEWKATHPDTMVLSPDTPLQNRYRPVRIGVFNRREAMFGDDGLPANALVVGVELDSQFKGYPLEELQDTDGVVNDTLAGHLLVVICEANAQVGLACSSAVDGRALEFYSSGGLEFELRDRQTDSVWDRQGTRRSRPLGWNLPGIRPFLYL